MCICVVLMCYVVHACVYVHSFVNCFNVLHSYANTMYLKTRNKHVYVYIYVYVYMWRQVVCLCEQNMIGRSIQHLSKATFVTRRFFTHWQRSGRHIIRGAPNNTASGRRNIQRAPNNTTPRRHIVRRAPNHMAPERHIIRRAPNNMAPGRHIIRRAPNNMALRRHMICAPENMYIYIYIYICERMII